MSLTKEQWQQDPEQAGVGAETFNTRVERRHTQVGAKLDHDFDPDNTVSLMVYGGNRYNMQYLSYSHVAHNLASGKFRRRYLKSSVTLAVAICVIPTRVLLAEGAYSFTIGTNYDT